MSFKLILARDILSFSFYPPSFSTGALQAAPVHLFCSKRPSRCEQCGWTGARARAGDHRSPLPAQVGGKPRVVSRRGVTTQKRPSRREQGGQSERDNAGAQEQPHPQSNSNTKKVTPSSIDLCTILWYRYDKETEVPFVEFSSRLKELRQQKGVSQATLANEIHISRSAVAKWENGLGLPSEDSLALLADYFGVDASELLADQTEQQTLVEKNQTIASQKKVIAGLLLGVGIGLLILGYVFIPPLREYLMLIAFGLIFIVLGVFNVKGNIATVHWYNRRKVTKENQLPYCRLVGLGTILIGAALILSALLQAFAGEAAGAAVILVGIIIGLVLILFAQFKYNRGLF